jgi:hypothetical protein
VIPWYTSGTAALQIQWVALLKDGKELNRDAHEGWSGADKRDLIYRIRAGKSAQKTTSTFTIRALVKPAGSLDSYGDVYLRKAKK